MKYLIILSMLAAGLPAAVLMYIWISKEWRYRKMVRKLREEERNREACRKMEPGAIYWAPNSQPLTPLRSCHDHTRRVPRYDEYVLDRVVNPPMVVVDEAATVPPLTDASHAPWLGEGGRSGGGGASGSWEYGSPPGAAALADVEQAIADAHTVIDTPAIDTAPACDPSPSCDTSSSDSGSCSDSSSGSSDP